MPNFFVLRFERQTSIGCTPLVTSFAVERRESEREIGTCVGIVRNFSVYRQQVVDYFRGYVCRDASENGLREMRLLTVAWTLDPSWKVDDVILELIFSYLHASKSNVSRRHHSSVSSISFATEEACCCYPTLLRLRFGEAAKKIKKNDNSNNNIIGDSSNDKTKRRDVI